MILLNTTFYIAEAKVAEVLPKIRLEYLPGLMASGLFTAPRLAEIMVEVGEGVRGYCLQVGTTDAQKAFEWHDGPGAELRKRLFGPYGQAVLPFTTPLKELPLDNE